MDRVAEHPPLRHHREARRGLSDARPLTQRDTGDRRRASPASSTCRNVYSIITRIHLRSAAIPVERAMARMESRKSESAKGARIDWYQSASANVAVLAGCSSGVFTPERCDRSHSLPEILLTQPFIGSVRVLSGQSEPEQQHRSAKYPFEIPNHWNRSSLTNDHRLLVECSLERSPRGVEQRTLELGAPGLAAVEIRNGCLDTLWRDALHVCAHFALDFRGSLTRHQPTAHLCHRATR